MGNLPEIKNLVSCILYLVKAEVNVMLYYSHDVSTFDAFLINGF